MDSRRDLLQRECRRSDLDQRPIDVPLFEYQLQRGSQERRMLDQQMESHTQSGERNADLISVSFTTREVDEDAETTRRSPTNPEKLAVKRVIALEGDTVYTRAPCPLPTVQVPVNHVWVEGDNRDRSQDSNTYGPLPKSLIQGKLTHVLWPWKSLGAIQWAQFKGKTRVIRGQRQDAPNWD